MAKLCLLFWRMIVVGKNIMLNQERNHRWCCWFPISRNTHVIAWFNGNRDLSWNQRYMSSHHMSSQISCLTGWSKPWMNVIEGENPSEPVLQCTAPNLTVVSPGFDLKLSAGCRKQPWRECHRDAGALEGRVPSAAPRVDASAACAAALLVLFTSTTASCGKYKMMGIYTWKNKVYE